MDKSLIMSIDNDTDLLGKEPPLGKLTYHPVPFPTPATVIVKRKEAVSVITQALEHYRDREFRITPDNYGLEVSVNYADGKFVSMITKGTGEQGERVADGIANMLMPGEAKSKKKMTLHALLSVVDLAKFRGELTKQGVEPFIKYCLLNGFPPYKDKEVVCRPYRLYVDGVIDDPFYVWQKVNNMTITGLYMDYDYENTCKYLAEDINNIGYLLPQRGMTVADQNPLDEKAFPETRFLFEDPNDETFV
jgi:hypothetical protein